MASSIATLRLFVGMAGAACGVETVLTAAALFIGCPHDGQDAALSETLFPHSGHFISAILFLCNLNCVFSIWINYTAIVILHGDLSVNSCYVTLLPVVVGVVITIRQKIVFSC
jgi:hypothetical protein